MVGSSTNTIPAGTGLLQLGQGQLLGLRMPVWCVVLALVVLVVRVVTLRRTRTGQTLFAVGGSEQAARLMGLPVARAKVAV